MNILELYHFFGVLRTEVVMDRWKDLLLALYSLFNNISCMFSLFVIEDKHSFVKHMWPWSSYQPVIKQDLF